MILFYDCHSLIFLFTEDASLTHTWVLPQQKNNYGRFLGCAYHFISFRLRLIHFLSHHSCHHHFCSFSLSFGRERRKSKTEAMRPWGIWVGITPLIHLFQYYTTCNWILTAYCWEWKENITQKCNFCVSIVSVNDQGQLVFDFRRLVTDFRRFLKCLNWGHNFHLAHIVDSLFVSVVETDIH